MNCSILSRTMRRAAGITLMSLVVSLLPVQPEALGGALRALSAPGAMAFSGANGLIAYTYPDQNGLRNIAVSQPDGSRFIGLGAGAKPSWSPNGTKIAYQYVDRDKTSVSVMSADGSGATHLTEGLNPKWSHDGRFIYYRDSWDPNTGIDSRTLWRWDVSANKATELGQIDQLTYSLSPTDDRVLYGNVCNWGDTTCSASITVTDADGSHPQKLYTVPAGHNEALYDPLYTPDGQYIVFVENVYIGSTSYCWPYSSAKVMEMPATGGTPRPIYDLGSDCFGSFSLSVSPDGTQVLLARGGVDQSTHSNVSSLLIIPLTGGAATTVTSTVSEYDGVDWQPLRLIINNAGDAPDAAGNAGKGVCDTGARTGMTTCTLRAAIQVANATPDRAQSITFDLKASGGKVSPITLTKPLPAVQAPVTIDGTTQPGVGAKYLSLIAITAGKGTAGSPGLELDATGSTVRGLAIAFVKGAPGLLLKGDGAHVQRCVFFLDATGIEIASKNDVIGEGDIKHPNLFFINGDAEAVKTYLDGLKGKQTSPAEFEAQSVHLGAGILVRHAGVSNLDITGNLLGVHGSWVADALTMPPDQANKLSITTTFGVLVAPSTGAVSGVTIEHNLIQGDLFGILATPGGGGSVGNLTINDNLIGTDSKDQPHEQIGNGFGIVAGGTISGLTIGADGHPNVIADNVMGAALLGQGITGAEVLDNFIGLGSWSDGAKSLRNSNIFGLLLGDVQGAQIGGGAGNTIQGNAIGLALLGEHEGENTIAGNTIGSAAPPTGAVDPTKLHTNQILGVLDAGGTHNTYGTAARPNTVNNNLIGMLFHGTNRNIVQHTSIQGSAFGLMGLSSSRNQIGGADAGLGDTLSRNVLGIILANINLTPQERKDAHVDSTKTTQGDLAKDLSRSDEQDGRNVVNALTTANLGPDAVAPLPEPGYGNVIQGSQLGGNGTIGDHGGNAIAALIAGDEHQTVIGGDNQGEGNLVANNQQGGIWLLGSTTHYPTTTVTGNRIHDNWNFTATWVKGIKGLGLDLVTGAGTPIEGHGFGPDTNDPKNPDAGVDSLQNYPVLTNAKVQNGQVEVKGTLHSVPSSTLRVDLYADSRCNPTGYGEGDLPIGHADVQTNSGGDGNFDLTEPLSLPGATSITATATSPTTLTGGGTSEFSQCLRLPGS